MGARLGGQSVTPQYTGLIGFDVETGRRFVRPELLRLLKRGNQRIGTKSDFALAA